MQSSATELHTTAGGCKSECQLAGYERMQRSVSLDCNFILSHVIQLCPCHCPVLRDHAAHNGDVDLAKYLVSEGCTTENKNIWGSTVLHTAVAAGEFHSILTSLVLVVSSLRRYVD